MSDEQRRDYSAVQWPWDDDPNWAAPREGATYDPGEDANWALACGVCALHFPFELELGTVAEHWDTLHGDEHGLSDSDEEPLTLHLVWIGLGAPPEARRAS